MVRLAANSKRPQVDLGPETIRLMPVIADQIKPWDMVQMGGIIELHVGRDRQHIRLNGTLIGDLAGPAFEPASARRLNAEHRGSSSLSNRGH
jgi:hypothetical protein